MGRLLQGAVDDIVDSLISERDALRQKQQNVEDALLAEKRKNTILHAEVEALEARVQAVEVESQTTKQKLQKQENDNRLLTETVAILRPKVCTIVL